MYLPRTRILTLIVAVAIAGFFLAIFRATTLMDVLVLAIPPFVIIYGAWALILPGALRHREHCLERARRHEAAEAEYGALATRGRDHEKASEWASRAAYHQEMRRKWSRAANWPWQAVEPDSLPPAVEPL